MNRTSVQVEGAPSFNGLRVDHPRIVDGIRTLLAKGYSNEHICKIIGMPQEVVDRERSRLHKLKS